MPELKEFVRKRYAPERTSASDEHSSVATSRGYPGPPSQRPRAFMRVRSSLRPCSQGEAKVRARGVTTKVG